MNVTKVNSGMLKGMNIKAYVPEEIKPEAAKNANKPQKADKMNTENQNFSTSWQRDVLLDALERLENTVQLDNNHPLDSIRNQPIETFDEALIELRFLNNPVFVAEASGAQANLLAESIIELFAEEPDLVN